MTRRCVNCTKPIPETASAYNDAQGRTFCESCVRAGVRK